MKEGNSVVPAAPSLRPSAERSPLIEQMHAMNGVPGRGSQSCIRCVWLVVFQWYPLPPELSAKVFKTDGLAWYFEAKLLH